MNYIETYYELIKSNKIIVSKKVRRQLDILINDIENPGKYHFDIKKATRPITFVERFCKQSKGDYLGKNLKLDLWQKVIIQSLFGFIDDNGRRKYNEILIVVGRKNGKSTLISAIALYMLFSDGEGGAQVCCVASKKDQAKIVFNEAKNMVVQSPILSKHIKKRKSDLYVPINFSTFEPLSSDSDTLDGLNLHCGIIDELHSIKDRNIYDVSKQSMSSRKQPILLMITTAGFIRENIYDSMYEYASRVLNEPDIDIHFLSFIYELDERKEWTNKKSYQKANPGLGTIKSLDFLYDMVKKAKEDRNFLPTVLTKDFNIRETGVGSWLNYETINNEEKYSLEDLRGSYAVGGVDLSSVGDLTCATSLILKNGNIFVLQMYFIPEETAERKEKEDKVPYKIWKEKGFVRFCHGNKVNYTDVTMWYLELMNNYEIYHLWIGFDSWNAQFWCQEMRQNGFILEEVIQGAKTMSAPMKTLATDLEAKKVNYNNNPVLKWCLTNTQIERDKNDNIRPVKGKNPKQRIDGTVSLIDAYVIFQRHYEDYINLT